MDIKTFVQLSGIDRLSPSARPIRRATLVGKLETRSLCSILGQLGRERQNGRLIIIEGSGHNSARREIQVVNGAPIFVFSDHPSMQLPELLVRHKIVNKDQLDNLLVEIAKREQPLLDLIRKLDRLHGRHSLLAADHARPPLRGLPLGGGALRLRRRDGPAARGALRPFAAPGALRLGAAQLQHRGADLDAGLAHDRKIVRLKASPIWCAASP